jgi:uncharacterized metal-binding protein
MAKPKREDLSCSDCGTLNCHRRDRKFPAFCLTEKLDGDLLADTLDLYRGDGVDARIAHAAAEVEGKWYGKLTRVEETVAFARRIGAKRVGIASCVGLMNETTIFTKVLEKAGLTPVTVACKIGSTDKTAIGIPEDWKIRKGGFEGLCNPALQARALNAEKTDLNVVVGLCVGHDSLFIRHSEAPVTVLVVKDRVLAHNPVAALHTTHSYCARLLDADHLAGL